MLTRYVGQQLARFKIPHEVEFVENLPHSALGKVQHFRIRQRSVDASGEPVQTPMPPHP
jgi:fatty-acyl-CoA synthase